MSRQKLDITKGILRPARPPYGLLLVACLCLIAAPIAFAPMAVAQSTPQSCDPEYMQAMKANAILDARREVAQSRNLIYKPDSVLEYSCFYGAVNIFEKTSSISIHSHYWDNAVRFALLGFVWQNFGHTYLGDRMQATGADAELTDFTMCGALARVWEFARCVNAMQHPNSDDFFGFKWFNENDPRVYPDEYQQCTAPAVELTHMKTAFNGLENLHVLPREPVMDETPYKVDKVGSLEKHPIYPKAQGDIACDSVKPIPTGLTIFRRQYDGSIFEYNEHICVVPGCNYMPDSKDSGKCE